MRNLKSVLKKIEAKLGFRKKEMVIFRVKYYKDQAKQKVAQDRLVKEYLKTHEPAGMYVFALHFAKCKEGVTSSSQY